MSQGLWGVVPELQDPEGPSRQPCGSLSSWFLDQDEEENMYLMVIFDITTEERKRSKWPSGSFKPLS